MGELQWKNGLVVQSQAKLSVKHLQIAVQMSSDQKVIFRLIEEWLMLHALAPGLE
jgi:hypothetical protein